MQALLERAPDEPAHAVALRDRKHLALDGTVEDRVGRLLGVEPIQTAALGDPLGLDDGGRQFACLVDQASGFRTQALPTA